MSESILYNLFIDYEFYYVVQSDLLARVDSRLRTCFDSTLNKMYCCTHHSYSIVLLRHHNIMSLADQALAVKNYSGYLIRRFSLTVVMQWCGRA